MNNKYDLVGRRQGGGAAPPLGLEINVIIVKKRNEVADCRHKMDCCWG